MTQAAVEPTPFFINNRKQFASATDLNTLRRNVGIADMQSFRLMPTFDTSADVETGAPFAYPAGNFLLARYRLIYKSGMTNLRVDGWAVSGGSERIKVFLNGGASALDLAATANWGGDIAIASGYTDGQLLTIEIQITGSRSLSSYYAVAHVYATPVTFATSWPGMPTFATTWDAAKLTQLGAATQWCLDRMGIVPRTARRMRRYANGPFKQATDRAADPGTATHGAYPLYTGSVLRAYSNDILRISGEVISPSANLDLVVYVNGTEEARVSYSAGPSPSPIYIPVALTHTLGQRAHVRLVGAVTNATALSGFRQSKWTFSYVGTNPDSSNYPYATLPAEFVGNAPIAASTIRDRLNALATIVSAVKSRIDATPHVFNRVFAMRDTYASGSPDAGRLARARPQLRRQGTQLQVRGRGVKLVWGGVTVPPPEETRPDFIPYDKHSFGQSHTLIEGSKTETKTIYLDTVPNLYPGTAYELDGDVDYAAELD